RVSRNTVTNRILNKVLQRETGNHCAQKRVGNSELRAQAIREACLLDRDVLPHEIEFFPKCDFVSLMARERAAQQFAQVFDDTHGTLAIVVANEHRNRVERVEKKMWIELRLQCREASAGELF